MRTRRPLLILAGILHLATTSRFSAAAEAGEGDEKDLVRASLVADVASVAPGGSFLLGVRLEMKPHWHTYWINPGESGDATQVALTGPDGFTFGQIQWPLPKRIDAPGGVSFGYEDDVLLIIPVTVSQDVKPGDVTIAADVKWLVCKETCIKGGAKLSLPLTVAAERKPANEDLFATWLGRLPVGPDDKAASIARVEQVVGNGGAPGNSVTIAWTQAPAKVEWFPVSTRAAVVEDVAVDHQGSRTTIRFKPTVFKADQLANGHVESVVVYETPTGERRGIAVPVRVAGP